MKYVLNNQNQLPSKLFFVVIVLGYLLNLPTIIRLNVDTIRYLSILEYLQDNSSFIAAKDDFFPFGFPWLLLLLVKFNLPLVQTSLVINLLAIIIGSVYCCKLMQYPRTYIAIAGVLLCWVNIKHATLIMPDLLFMSISMMCIYYINHFINTNNKKYLVLIFVLLGFAIYLRSAGVFLPFGVISYIAFKYIKSSNKTVFRISTFAIIVLIGVAFLGDKYFSLKIEYLRQLQLSKLFSLTEYSIFFRLIVHIKEFGEVMMNISSNKLEHIAGKLFSTILLIGVGIASIYIFARFVFKNRLYHYFPFWPISAYFIIIFLWPFTDSRFFIPIIPFITVGALKLLEKLSSIKLKNVVMVTYCLMGVIGLIYSAKLSMNKQLFLSNYGTDLELRKNYNAAVGDTTLSTPYGVDKNVVFLINKYNQ